MTTVQQVIDRTRSRLTSGQREGVNSLLTAVASTATTTLAFARDLGTIAPGSILSAGLERMLVWEEDRDARTVVVERGYQGTTKRSSIATTEIIRVDARFDDFAIVEAINDELASFPAEGLFRVAAKTFTANSTGVLTYDFAVSDVREIVRVQYDSSATANHWPDIREFDLLRDLADFTGDALRLYRSVEQGRSIRVHYFTSFTSVAAATDAVETVAGLPATAVDILPLGAALRLVPPEEVARSDRRSASGSRQEGAVPPGSVARSAGSLVALRDRRVRFEASALRKQWPRRRPR